jgi:putative oxidoreductase
MNTRVQPLIPPSEPKLVFSRLAPFYARVRDLSYLLIRVTVGGQLLVHGIVKLMGPGVMAFAAGSLARRGIEPSVPLAFIVFFNETVGAVCLIFGLFTRLIAPIIAVQFLVITIVHFHNGYSFTSPGGGWEYPLLWGLIIFAVSLRGGGPYSLDRVIGKEV